MKTIKLRGLYECVTFSNKKKPKVLNALTKLDFFLNIFDSMKKKALS